MKQAMWIAWPSFLVAGLLEALVFAAVDPQELLVLLEPGWSRTGLYSITFLMFWASVCVASALSLWLAGAGTMRASSSEPGPVPQLPQALR